MFSKAKGEIVAAVAISAGLLIAAGYGISFAELKNAGVPTRPVLSALSESFYLGSALESILLPLVILLTLGGAILLFGVDRALPSRKAWAVYGVLLAGYSAVLVTLGDGTLGIGIGGDLVVAMVVTTLAAVGLTVGLGEIGRVAIEGVENPTRIHRLQVAGAVLLIGSVATASGFRIANAGFGDRPLPFTSVFLSTDDCPPAADVTRVPGVDEESGVSGTDAVEPTDPTGQPPRCSTGGFLLGESDQWIFIAREGPTATTPESLGGRLLLVPRDAVSFGVVANDEEAARTPAPETED